MTCDVCNKQVSLDTIEHFMDCQPAEPKKIIVKDESREYHNTNLQRWYFKNQPKELIWDEVR